MVSIQGRFFRFLLRNRHWFKGRLRPEVITVDTSLSKLREEVRVSAAKMSKLPPGIQVFPAVCGGVPGEWIVPRQSKAEQLILYFHGSGFVMGTSRDHRGLVANFSARCGVKALVFDYSLAPEKPFPAAVLDSVAVYGGLLEEGYLPENIIFAGDSAGACIAFSTLLMLKERHVTLPRAVVALSPCTDLSRSGASHITKAKCDPATPPGANETYMNYYIGLGDPLDPFMSPLYGDLAGLPPVMIHVGECETLLDDSLRFSEKVQAAGGHVRLRVWEGMFHCFPLLAPMFPEAVEAMDEISSFIRGALQGKEDVSQEGTWV